MIRSALIFAVCLLALASAAEARPNIVVVMTDDQREGTLQYMPRVSALIGRQGVTFKNSFAEFPLCCPSRATWMTGQTAPNHGVRGNMDFEDGAYQAFLPREANALPVWLKVAGYATSYIGKYLNSYAEYHDGTHIPVGWDNWQAMVAPKYFNWQLNENGTIRSYGSSDSAYSTDVLMQKALSFIENAEQPFFLLLSVYAPHLDKTAGESWLTTPAPRHLGSHEGLTLPKGSAYNEQDVSDKPSYVKGKKSISPKLEAKLSRYYRGSLDSLLAVDEGVEKLVQELEQSGKLDNTIIIFTSDNGFMLGEHRLTNKAYPYEMSLRVPLMMRGPGIPANETRDQMVTNVDLVATIVDVAGAAPYYIKLDGRSVMPVVQNNQAPWRSAFGFTCLNEPGKNPPKRCSGVRTPSWKYILNVSSGAEELYDLANDPDEMVNRAGAAGYAQQLVTMRGIFDTLKNCVGEGCWYAQ